MSPTGKLVPFRPRPCRLTTDVLLVVDAARALVAEDFAAAHAPDCRCSGCRLRVAVRRLDPAGCAA